ncbi:MAG: Gfo/Idh/MocA family oxidoreductase [Candidatus Poribacteria bacterium]|nr:Gfo/Idh/MocA family oxidoreductase [Candidatus Poribacteria bacterium]
MAVRFGLIGCGVVSPTHAAALNGIEGVQLAAAADTSQERLDEFTAEFGIPRSYTDYRRLLDDPSVDAVCVCSPHFLHAPMAIEAAEAGKHVLVEKPMATSLEDADRLIQVCGERGVLLGAVLQHRFDPAAIYVKRLIDEGLLGIVTLASVFVRWFREADYYDPNSWRGSKEKAGGGVLINQAIHALDVLCWAMGGAVSVTGYCTARAYDIEVEDTAAAALRFANGAIGIVEASTAAYPQTEERIEISGTLGTVVIEGERVFTRGLKNAPPLPEVEEESRFQGKSYYGRSHPRALEDFAAAVAEGRPPKVDGAEGRKVLETIFAIYESSRLGGRETPILGGAVK